MTNTRRFFLKKAGYGIVSAATLTGLSYLSGCTSTTRNDADSRIDKCVDNPYEKVNWKKNNQICSTTHLHLTAQKHFDNAYASGLRHFAVSNYYPSAPYYPLKTMRKDQFRVRQDHAVVVNGTLQPGPFNWNEIIMDKETGWYDEVDPKLQKNLPFKTGDYIFKNIPDDITESPNAEHHNFTNTNTRTHINCPGSTYASGTFDNPRRDPSYELDSHGYSVGTGVTWQQAFDRMLEQLQFADAGGITINHPVWSELDIKQACEMLDYDDRVLGIEIWNETTEKIKKGFSLEMWDQILATGRRCYGFSVPDHGVQRSQNWIGRNYLLVPEFTEHQCLKAYRDGCFYCALLGNGLKFEEITFAKGVLSVRLNKQAGIKVISDKGVSMEKNSNSVVYEVPVDSGKPVVTYVRVEAQDDTGERIFSQPIMFKGKLKGT